MDEERWRRIERVFHAAQSRGPEARSAFLRAECGADLALLHEVESLLAQQATAGGFLAKPVAAVATDVSRGRDPSLLGRRLGVYELQAWLGAGRVGQVYRARDTRLGRDVAIRILPRTFTDDLDRLVRLKREAHILATLDNPGIVTTFGIEESDGSCVVVMEMADGETLAERLRRGPLLLPDALHVGRQIADALEAAHEVAIVLGCLKPSNVRVTTTGAVKVLDFCLDGGQTRHLLPPTNQTGPTFETVDTDRAARDLAYRSPEQVQGEAFDKRADIWSFGCVLYEMLTGVPAFGGYRAGDAGALMMHGEPEWRALPATLPAGLRRLLTRCLDTDQRRRLRDIGEARVELENAAAALREPDSRTTPGSRAAEPLPAEPHYSSAQMLRRAQAGDRAALDGLFERYLPALRRWAHGRLPPWARGLADTADVVQDAVLRTLKGLDRFDPKLEHALQAYLRQAVQNRIIDELRRTEHHRREGTVDQSFADHQPSPLDQALDQESREQYRLALERLGDDDRQLIVARLDLGYSYEQIALVTGRSTPDSARVAIRRAVQKLAQEMKRVERAQPGQ